MVLRTDFTGRAQKVAVGTLCAAQISHSALHFEATWFAGGWVFGDFRIDPEILIFVGRAGEDGW